METLKDTPDNFTVACLVAWPLNGSEAGGGLVLIQTLLLLLCKLRWLNRVMQDHEARASDLNRKLIFSFFLLFS